MPYEYMSLLVEYLPFLISGGQYPFVLANDGAVIMVLPETDLANSSDKPKSPILPLQFLSINIFGLK